MASLVNNPSLSPSPEASNTQYNETQITTGTAVRAHGIHFIRQSWQNISTASKFMLIASIFFTVSQITVSIAVLVLYRQDTCDKPLDTYLTVHIVRVGLLLPLVVHRYLTRPLFLQQQQEHRPNSDQQMLPVARETQDYGPSPSTPSLSARQDPPSPQREFRPGFPLASNILSVQNHSNSYGALKEWCERLKSLLELFGILWFIVGNYLIFTSETCTYKAPGQYYTILGWVLLNYLIILVPIILCASVIFCLPGILVVLRLFNITEVPWMTTGASQEEILKIPIFKYESHKGDEFNAAASGSVLTKDQAINTQRKSFSTITMSWVRRLFLRSKNKKNDIENKSYPPITMNSLEDAVCSICLSDYETGDLICKLWCGHHFHKDCVHEWLGLNSLCPLCKQNFRGKDPVTADEIHSSGITTHPVTET
ncbi:hypothetical protein BCR42DRAFT_350017 [Absidia repens]|uniref:RING-type domain-containing protein n=1 Tax=Absidia repens TaxID=90262 RepID=A0A1X2IJH3_9FUNG|nr:hypothetical protein BCR42DRAFT_350017 [Absidia repens]